MAAKTEKQRLEPVRASSRVRGIGGYQLSEIDKSGVSSNFGNYLLRLLDDCRGFLVGLGLYGNAVLAGLLNERVGVGVGLLDHRCRGLIQLLELVLFLGERLCVHME